MENKYFATSNFYLSCFLFVQGLELVNIESDPSNPARSQFVFKDSQEREKLIHYYNFAKENSSKVMIDARKLITAIKTLKDGLYQAKTI